MNDDILYEYMYEYSINVTLNFTIIDTEEYYETISELTLNVSLL